MKKNSLNMAQTRPNRVCPAGCIFVILFFCLKLIVSVAYKSLKSKMYQVIFFAARFEAMVFAAKL